MAIITKDQIKKAIGLGTLNPKIINDFFYNIKLKSYDYDYLIQEQLIDLTSVRNSFYEVIKRSEVVSDAVREGKKDRVGVLQIDKDIVYYNRRKLYRANGKNNKPITLDDIMADRSLYKFGILCFINGRIDLSFTLKAAEDKTFIYFPYHKWISKIKETDVIDTVFIPESYITTSRTLNAVDKINSRTLACHVFPKFDKKYMAECKGFIGYLTPIEPGVSSLFIGGIEYDMDNQNLIFPSDLPADISKFNLTLVGLERYSQTIEVTSSTEYLQIERKKMPIPKNNLLIMVRDSNGYSYHVNTTEIQIKEYYPNVYQVINPNKLYCKVIVLYADNPQNELIDYDDEIKYYLSKVDLLDRYKKNNVPDALREYEPVKWDYLIQDYEKKAGIVTPTGNKWYPFLYKLNKISSIYKLWCEFFQTYLKKTYGFMDGWTLDISTIDLEARARMDTNPELPLSSGVYHRFTSKTYLFVYRNDGSMGVNLPYAWFIDGRYVVPVYSIAYKGYQYVYFDATLFTPNSIMEVERYDGQLFSRAVDIKTDYVVVNMNWLKQPILANALFLTDEAGNYITYGEGYEVSIRDEFFGPYDIPLDLQKSVYILKPGCEIKISPKSVEYCNKTIYLNCNNCATCYDINTNQLSTFDEVNLNEFENINRTDKNIINRLRLFNPEGRLYPKHGYMQYETTNIEEPPRFTLMASTSEGIPFKVEYMGYDEKEIYRLDEIPENGLINLNGKIDKPFSLVYHDIFLNGYKLNKNQIEVIAPFYIAIKNVNTRKSFIIYERVKGDEIFKFLTDEKSQYIADKLFEEDKEYFDKVIDGLEDIIVDPTIEDMEDRIDVLIGLLRDFIAINFVNGDEEYTPEQLDYYESLFDDGWRLYLNADERVDFNLPVQNWFYLSHDYNILYNGK